MIIFFKKLKNYFIYGIFKHPVKNELESVDELMNELDNLSDEEKNKLIREDDDKDKNKINPNFLKPLKKGYCQPPKNFNIPVADPNKILLETYNPNLCAVTPSKGGIGSKFDLFNFASL